MIIYNKYGVDIVDLYNRFLRKYNAVLCRGTALVLEGYSNTWGIPVEYYYIGKKPLPNTSYFTGYEIESYKGLDIVEVYGVPCTDIEYSICDSLRDEESDEQLIIESVADYLTRIGRRDVNILKNKAEQFNVSKELKYYLDNAKDYYCY